MSECRAVSYDKESMLPTVWSYPSNPQSLKERWFPQKTAVVVNIDEYRNKLNSALSSPTLVNNVQNTYDYICQEIDDILEDYSENGWDGENNTLGIAKEVAEDAKKVAAWLGDNIQRPSVEPSSDGRITFFWNNDEYDIGLGIYPDHAMSYSLRAKGKMPDYYDGNLNEIVIGNIREAVKNVRIL